MRNSINLIIEGLEQSRMINETASKKIILNGSSEEFSRFMRNVIREGNVLTLESDLLKRNFDERYFPNVAHEALKCNKLSVEKVVSDTNLYATIKKGTKIEYVGFDRGDGGYYSKYIFCIKGTNIKFTFYYGEVGSDLKTTFSCPEFSKLKIYNSDEERVEAIDKEVKSMLKELNVKDLHLVDYNTLKRFEKNLENKIYSLEINNARGVSSLGFNVAGNSTGLTSSYIQHLCNDAWEEVTMTNDEIREYLEKHKNIKVFKDGQYFSHDEVGTAEILTAKYGTTSKNIGYGSQSSVHITKVKLLKDKEGNLCLSSFTEIWD